ncbi:hypothetical protein [Intrasporangium sp. YIM S08009]|uniref:hypothetical protein n=1 Tax=Intrasporangium zincisolvens TaxID=3080018 RepID=UPI002B0569F8|nr:hypothetical protein [Intrasporangium sp. YIM S08009]
MRHLTERQAEAALVRGAGVEQMLTVDLDGGTVEWLFAARGRGDFELTRFAVVDEGGDGLADVNEFRPVDADEYPGEGVVIARFPGARELLEGAAAEGARADRWVNHGVIQDEYRELGSTRWGGPGGGALTPRGAVAAAV